jgi:hypothetical protein
MVTVVLDTTGKDPSESVDELLLGSEPLITAGEVAIATTNRNAGWISTEYANQSSPGTFYTLGAEQPVP